MQLILLCTTKCSELYKICYVTDDLKDVIEKKRWYFFASFETYNIGIDRSILYVVFKNDDRKAEFVLTYI